MLLLLLAIKLFSIFTHAGDLEAQRDVTFEEAKQFAEENGLMFVEASGHFRRYFRCYESVYLLVRTSYALKGVI